MTRPLADATVRPSDARTVEAAVAVLEGPSEESRLVRHGFHALEAVIAASVGVLAASDLVETVVDFSEITSHKAAKPQRKDGNLFNTWRLCALA